MTRTEHSGGLEVLSHDECYRLLATQVVGRIGVFAEHYPVIYPVNFALDHETVVLRMRSGMKQAASQHANVTFEVDEIDRERRTGWSVLVRGLAEEVTERHSADIVRRTTASGVQPWAPGSDWHWMRIIPHGVAGRRIRPTDDGEGEPEYGWFG